RRDAVEDERRMSCDDFTRHLESIGDGNVGRRGRTRRTSKPAGCRVQLQRRLCKTHRLWRTEGVDALDAAVPEFRLPEKARLGKQVGARSVQVADVRGAAHSLVDPAVVT